MNKIGNIQLSKTQGIGMVNSIFDNIKQIINDNEVVLFMKGTADLPKCGFSATVAAILQKMKVEFVAVDVLEDEALRQAIKEYSEWPTIPQLYVHKVLIGGCDIIKELYHNKGLHQLLQAKNIQFSDA